MSTNSSVRISVRTQKERDFVLWEPTYIESLFSDLRDSRAQPTE